MCLCINGFVLVESTAVLVAHVALVESLEDFTATVPAAVELRAGWVSVFVVFNDRAVPYIGRPSNFTVFGSFADGDSGTFLASGF